MASVASVYSRAIFDYASKENKAEQVINEMTDFESMCKEHKDLRALLSELLDRDAREALVNSLAMKMDLTNEAKRVLVLLASKNRIASLSEIIHSLKDLFNEKRNLVSGKILSAKSLSDAESQKLSGSISKKLGKEVQLQHEVDEKLLGGFIVTAGGKTFDASLRSQLDKLRSHCSAF